MGCELLVAALVLAWVGEYLALLLLVLVFLALVFLALVFLPERSWHSFRGLGETTPIVLRTGQGGS